MNTLTNLFISEEFLQEKETAEAVQAWLLKESTTGLTEFYPNIEALSIVSTLPLDSPLRTQARQSIDLSGEFEMPVIDELICWFYTEYKGASLSEAINVIIESQNTSNLTSNERELLNESLYLVYEETKNDDAWFRDMLSNFEGLQAGFDTFKCFIEKFNITNQEEILFSYCIGVDTGSILAELLKMDKIKFTNFDSINDLASQLDLHSLAYYSNEDMSPCETFTSDGSYINEDAVINAILDCIKEDETIFINIANKVHSMNLVNNDLSEIVGEKALSILAKASKGSLDHEYQEEQANIAYKLLVNENVFNFKDEIQCVFSNSEEDASYAEADKAVSEHSIFNLKEKYYDEGEKFVIEFDILSLIADLNADGDLFEYQDLNNYYTAENYLSECLFDKKISSTQCDLDVPDYGFSGDGTDYLYCLIEEFLIENKLKTTALTQAA